MQIPVMAVVLLFSVIIHECAHGLAARRLGDDTAHRMGRLTLNPLPHIDLMGTIIIPLVMAIMPGRLLFGWAKPVPVNARNFRRPVQDQALVAVAGPASNLLLAAACSILLGIVAAGEYSRLISGGQGGPLLEFLHLLLITGIQLNVLLALFNLIPIPPLDGSWVLFSMLRGEAAAQYARLRPFGFLILLALLWSGLGGVLGRAIGIVAGLYLSLANGVLHLLT